MTRPSWPKVEDLYHAALEKQPAEREAFLDQACGGDEEVRREVQSLLGHEREAERLMERPAMSVATQKLAVVRGTRLGPYEVTDLVGAGGMGEVYRARDTRLGRDVAIKVLPEHVAHDPAALSRFDHEARAVAALSHPHIEALFDIGETDGTRYLVMELLEGETLATRLRRGALPEKDALRIGAEIAEALGAAHAHGIVHRDVKPANVMLTRSGVKLLDFGLARLQRTAGSPGETTAATTELGERGVAGTLPYMAPEQLEGKEADARADIWALGCVLFEMLAGRRAFEGEGQASLIAAIEKDEVPSVAAHRPAASSALDQLVRHCLKKDPSERWQSAHDLSLRLWEIAESGQRAEASVPAARRARLSVLLVLTGSVLLAVALLAGRRWLRPSATSPTGPVVRSSIDLPAGTAMRRQQWTGPTRTQLVFSPDGTLLVWSGAPTDSPDSNVHAPGAVLYRRRLDAGETAPIPGTEDGSQPFFSPDGRWVGFWARGRLRKVPVDGGVPVDLAAVSDWPPMGSFWAPDGRIFLGSLNPSGGLAWVTADGGNPVPLTRVDRNHEIGHRLPWVLPGGRALLFTAMAHAFGVRARIESLTLASGARKVLVEDAADGRYLPTGHLLFVRRGVLLAAPFDPERLALTGPAVPVLEGVDQALNTGLTTANSASAQFAVSPSGLLAYAPGGIIESSPNDLVLVDRAGRATLVPGLGKPLAIGQARFSPDGRRIAFVEQAISGRLWLFDVERRTHRALSREGIAGFPLWSPDGTRLVVRWSMAGPMSLWCVPVDTGGAWDRLTDGHDVASSWSPDGRVIAFAREGPGGGWDIFLYRFEDHRSVPFLATAANEWSAAFSPDGRWLAYVSNESGRDEVYVTSFPDRRRTVVVSPRGGSEPVWSRDGEELFYRSPGPPGEAFIMSVAVTRGEAVALGRSRVLFADSFGEYGAAPGFDVTPDGRRFLFARTKEGAAPQSPAPITRVHLVHNWFAELERLCPTKRAQSLQDAAK